MNLKRTLGVIALVGLYLLFFGLGLVAAAPARALSIGPQQGSTAAQVVLVPEGFGRFASGAVDGDLLDALALAPSFDAPLTLASSGGLRISYLGSSAARDAQLVLASTAQAADPAFADPARQLFASTRVGCSYADYLQDEFCLIGSVGHWRDITGLAPGEGLVLGLRAHAQTAGEAAQQRAIEQDFFAGAAGQPAAARALRLDDGSYLIGFEEGSDADFNDMVFRIEAIPAVPEPAAGLCLLLGLMMLLGACRALPTRRR